MPEMTIQLRCDPATGKRDIVVKLHGDEDLLPIEHEQLHRELVDRLLEGGMITPGEEGRLIVEREEGAETAPSQSQTDPPTAKPVASKQ
jgi:hypothetical protein